ncbi:ribosome silencing factor [Peptostreptococcaceae bacterium AGR-M142]
MDYKVMDLLKVAVDSALDKLGEDVKVLEIGKVSSLTGYFLIASASSKRQLNALTDNIEDNIKEEFDLEPHGKEGRDESGWYVLDYGDLMVHIFSKEQRIHYNLENIWKDAPTINLDELQKMS